MPTFWQVLSKRGLKAAINFKAERICVYGLRLMHQDAKAHGFNLSRPGYKNPWWFKIASKVEWWTR